jgi:hypothetical protein
MHLKMVEIVLHIPKFVDASERLSHNEELLNFVLLQRNLNKREVSLQNRPAQNTGGI